MKAVIGRAVKVAFNALGDLVEDCQVIIPTTGDFSWASNTPDTTRKTVSARGVLVDEKMKHSRESAKQRWIIVEFTEMPELFTEIHIGGRKYTCGTPLVSYKFIFMAEVYEIL